MKILKLAILNGMRVLILIWGEINTGLPNLFTPTNFGNLRKSELKTKPAKVLEAQRQAEIYNIHFCYWCSISST